MVQHNIPIGLTSLVPYMNRISRVPLVTLGLITVVDDH